MCKTLIVPKLDDKTEYTFANKPKFNRMNFLEKGLRN